MFKVIVVFSSVICGTSLGAPSGSYQGSKTILGQNIDATITIDDTTHLDLGISGATTIDCKKEQYTYDGSSRVTLPNAGSSDDCVGKALKSEKLTLKSVAYDSSKDEITVTIKKLFLSIDITLDKKDSSRIYTKLPKTCTPSALPLGDVLERLQGLVLSGAAPSGLYEGKKTIFGQDVDASITIDDGNHLDLAISGPATISCKKESYTLNATSITLPTSGKTGDCIHDSLQQYSAELKQVTYDGSKDEIAVQVSAMGLPVTLTLDKSSPLNGLVTSQVKCPPTLTCQRIHSEFGVCG